MHEQPARQACNVLEKRPDLAGDLLCFCETIYNETVIGGRDEYQFVGRFVGEQQIRPVHTILRRSLAWLLCMHCSPACLLCMHSSLALLLCMDSCPAFLFCMHSSLALHCFFACTAGLHLCSALPRCCFRGFLILQVLCMHDLAELGKRWTECLAAVIFNLQNAAGGGSGHLRDDSVMIASVRALMVAVHCIA